jgi:hypothetical protein
VKEQGNIAFKAKRFDDAVELYTQAIGIHNHPQFSQHRNLLSLQKYGKTPCTSRIVQHLTWPSTNFDQL